MNRGILLFLLAFASFFGCRKSDYLIGGDNEIIKDDGNGTGTVTFRKGHRYVLEGLVFVNDGQVLTIEPGAVVRFRSGQAENASALIVSRGAKIIANGTKEDPIIFTAETDDLEGSVPLEARGLWGGLILLGNAPVNLKTRESFIEGIPLSEPRGVFGGIDGADNSGILRFVSIRHGGTNIGEGNEVNGLTLGGIGNRTEIDYVEVISNEDDGIEIFGGTVNLKHIVVSGCGDDAFDYDLGWTGNGQFWLGVQEGFNGDNLIEAGGGTNPVNGLPNSLPILYNLTLVGHGNNGIGALALFERNAGGIIANSVLLNDSKGVVIESSGNLNDSYHQWQIGKLAILNNLFYQVAKTSPESIFELSGIYTQEQKSAWEANFSISGNVVTNPDIDWGNGIYVPKTKLKGNLAEYPATGFQTVDFKGAFGEDNWLIGWTLFTK